MKSYLFDTTFGTCDQMRCQLEIDYTAKSLKIPYKKGKHLDSMLILPKSNYGDDSEVIKMARLNSLDKKFTDQLNTSSISFDRSGLFKDSINKTLNFEDAHEVDINTIVIFCQPNGAVYEVNCYNRLFLDLYVENGVSVLLWNYRGYGRSSGYPSMRVNQL